MKLSVISAVVLCAFCQAAANTVVEGHRTLPSATTIAVTVSQNSKPIDGIRVDIYREIPNGEHHFWTVMTNRHGVVSPPKLPYGKYRVVADSGKSDDILYLLVNLGEEANNQFDMELAPYPSTATIEKHPEPVFPDLAAVPVSTELEEFRGVVQDTSQGVIPGIKIKVFLKKALDKPWVAEIESDQVGEFATQLDEGTYVAIFEGRHFKMRVLGFEISKKGWKGFRVTMEIEGNPDDVPPQEWFPKE